LNKDAFLAKEEVLRGDDLVALLEPTTGPIAGAPTAIQEPFAARYLQAADGMAGRSHTPVYRAG